MTKCVKYRYIETINYTDGTPPQINHSEGTKRLREDLPPSASDKAGLIRWVEAQMDGKSRIEDFLFKHRKDPTHTRAKYASIKYEVTDAWLVEYP
jgi:hypothetical protein